MGDNNDDLAYWRKYATELYEENLLLKEEQERVSGTIGCLRTKLYAKEQRCESLLFVIENEESNHEKQVDRLNTRISNLSVKLRKMEEEKLLNDAALLAAEERNEMFQGQIFILRGLCGDLRKKCDELTIDKRALEVIVEKNGVSDKTAELCKLQLINKELVERLKKLSTK